MAAERTKIAAVTVTYAAVAVTTAATSIAADVSAARTGAGDPLPVQKYDEAYYLDHHYLL
jgi:hypothetical protein